MSVNVILPGAEPEIVYVRMPPDGDPKPCLKSALGAAIGYGYVSCDAPGSEAVEKANILSPDETAADREERLEREKEARSAAIVEQLMDLGVNRSPMPGCEACGGSGEASDGSVAPCTVCFPEVVTAAEAAAAAAAATTTSTVGTDNGGAIVGGPGEIGVGAPRSEVCGDSECEGLCGICPPPARVTVRQGRELNRNRRALGKPPLKIDGGAVGEEG